MIQQQAVPYNDTPSDEEIVQEHTVLSFPARPGIKQSQPGRNSDEIRSEQEQQSWEAYVARAYTFAMLSAILEERPFVHLTSDLKQDEFFFF